MHMFVLSDAGKSEVAQLKIQKKIYDYSLLYFKKWLLITAWLVGVP